MNLRQAAQQALEALKCGDTLFYPQTRIAISALIEALAEPSDTTYLQDWDLLKATQESLREHMAEIQRLRAALAEEALQRLTSVSQEIEAALAEPDRMTPKELAKRLERGEKWELAEPEQEPVEWMEMVVANLVREGVNKHKARQLAHHFAAPPQRKPLSDEHPLMVFAKECVLGAYSEKELADAANRAIKYAHSFKGEA